jgi:hypothetical protein
VFLGASLSMFGLAGTAFWLWMVVDCARNDPDRGTWIWILLFFNVPGAMVYFAVRKAPTLRVGMPAALGGFTRRREIWQAEAAAKNIGKAHQYVTLGDLYRQTGKRTQAREAYGRALDLEPENEEALWGASLVEASAGDHPKATAILARLLQMKPDYSYGEASLAYARETAAQGPSGNLEAHLRRHLDRWHHPEARILLARALAERGEKGGARAQLEAVLDEVRSAPPFSYRANRRWVSCAKRLLKKL